MSQAGNIRHHYPKPKHPLEQVISRRSSRIVVKHPGYFGSERLLTLPASDGIQQDRAYHDVVHTACAIIADNHFDGWLSETRDGTNRVRQEQDGLLAAGTYYFHVPLQQAVIDATSSSVSKLDYPIVPNFRSWRFPHHHLPRYWQETEEGIEADEGSLQTCRITLTSHPRTLQNSHIIPASEKTWFADNGMDVYGNLSGRGGQDVADMSKNIIKLRTDLHQLWDASDFSVLPKRKFADDKALWTVHSMTEDRELLELYHNVPLHTLDRPPEFLFARFAMDIFPKMLGFLQTRHARFLAVPQVNGEVETRLFSGEECQAFGINQGRGRSTSPTKRPRTDTGGNGPADLEGESVRKRRWRSSERGTASFDSAVSGLVQSNVDEDRQRSRSRSMASDASSSLAGCACFDCWIGRTAHSKQRGGRKYDREVAYPGRLEPERGRKRYRPF
ncbi:hypothetical protein LTR62_003209 [Meristemomyces frigidus]|uniref:HNH nuclease domain-containing protein n=1 Tax=Meristemomyces frigidus TaxID=1508187 RepID=A0AAN7TLJ8_9PEZI|nr:hypothetical protein LTR62_003209 [Meristemomyces frigidus]